MTALYLHIPFCKKKCSYCDFVSYAGKEELIDEYVESICKEIQLATLDPERSRGGLRTIYFGGGTPTLLEPKHFDKIISTIICHLSFDICHSEVSVEANPGTANKAKLKDLRQLGINRLSIGAQSFNNHHLKVLGRFHTAEETFRFYDDARTVGFDNINFDLIFALPDQTLDEWKKDLQTAINLNPDHLSTYDLVLHENSPLKSLLRTQNSELPTEETELAMYEHTIETLIAAGFKHYEIGNFAKSGFECQHNIVYWKNGNYLGIGAGAHSHVDGKRWANSNSIEEYLKGAPRTTHHDSPHATAIFMGLRLLDGLEVEKFNGFEKEVAELIEDGLLRRENNHYKLTRRGLYLGNLVFERFV